jgi:O-methyltransferase involved in polyketide biosynthesis
MDELIVASLNQQPAPRTLINIGAGFDARPYRLALPPDTKVIEIDQAEVFEVKEELLPATNSPVPLTRLVKDIEDHSWARELRLVVRQRLSTVVTEGLLAYFPDRFLPVFAQQLARLPVATWMADVVSLGTAERLNAVRAGEGAERLCFHGMGSLEPLRQADWVCTEIRPLVAHDGSLWGPAHHEGGVTSTIPDCVAVFRRLPV